jgi:hypothetical protein
MIGKVVKIALAVLFFICLLDMPYGYFQLVRFAAFNGLSQFTRLDSVHIGENDVFVNPINTKR